MSLSTPFVGRGQMAYSVLMEKFAQVKDVSSLAMLWVADVL